MKPAILSLACLLIGSSLGGQISYNILLSGSQVNSLGEATGSAGYATVVIDGTTLNYEIHHEGTSGVTMAHFHGPAAPGVDADVVLPIEAGESPITGSAELGPRDLRIISRGSWYLNLHTAENGPGELRGQLVDQLPFTPNNLLSGSQEVPALEVPAAGAAHVAFDPDTRQLSWQLAWEGLTGEATMIHFHGPAPVGANAGPVVDIGAISGLGSPSAGSTVLSEEQASDLLAGLWYINIHTAENGPGEIRGQVLKVDTGDWNGYPLQGAFVNTGDFLGWLDISTEPWLFSFSLDRFIFLQGATELQNGAWVYLPAFDSGNPPGRTR
jgi:hypothetical protein